MATHGPHRTGSLLHQMPPSPSTCEPAPRTRVPSAPSCGRRLPICPHRRTSTQRRPPSFEELRSAKDDRDVIRCSLPLVCNCNVPRSTSPVVKVQSSDRNEIGTRYLQSQLLFEFPDGAVNKGIAVVVVLTPNVTAGPQYDLVVKRITARLFAPSKTQHIPISVPYDNDGKRLHSRFVVLYLISTSKLRLVDLTEKPIRSVVGNEVIVGKRLGHQVLGI